MDIYLLKMPFINEQGQLALCKDCAVIATALHINKDWGQKINVHYIDYKRPRTQLEVLEPGLQSDWLPLLRDQDLSLTCPVDIVNHIASKIGGTIVN